LSSGKGLRNRVRADEVGHRLLSLTPGPAGYVCRRTRLANERTFLTYVRTSLAMTGFGLALIQLHPVRGGALGYAAIAVAGVVILIGWLRFRQRRREIEAC